MKLYVVDYFGDTHHLGVVEHGAYLLLLLSMWRAGGSLPANDVNLASLARCTPEQWAEIKPVVMPFFRISRGRLTHKRVAEEISKYEGVSATRSEAGKRGGRKKGSKNNDPEKANASAAENKTEAIAPITQNSESIPVSNDTGPDDERVVDPAGRVEDLDQQAWSAAVDVLTTQGRATEKAARSFFGRLISTTKLQARDLLPALTSAKVNRTQDPQGYLKRSAEQIAQRRGVGVQPQQVEWC